ncbi:MAG: ATP-binding protein [Eubacteriales bacterium]
MFKNVFTKYIVTFMVIIGGSFIAIAVVISAMVTNYSIDAKQEAMQRTLTNVGMYIESEYWYGRYLSFMSYLQSDPERISQTLAKLAQSAQFAEDSIIFITDPDGTVMCSSVEEGYITGPVPSDIIASVVQGQSLPVFTTLGGILPERHLVFAMPVTTSYNYVLGTIFIASTSTTISSFVNKMVSMIVVSCFIVLLASMIAVYYISEMIVRPMRQMSAAAKNFAAGRFDIRVPVTGQDEVAQLAGAFNNMASSLAQNEEMNRNFISNISHDLRTPMTTIAGFIDGILDGAIPAEKHGYYLGIIASEVRRLSRLVNQLLDITRIQAGERKFNKIPFDICEMARVILISFEQKIDAKKIQVDIDFQDDRMMVLADKDATHQVLYNLCDNAVKFTKEGMELKISIKLKDKKVRVTVWNEGDGISADDLPYVFDRFYKSDRSRGLDKTGVGLGLFIVKTIVENQEEEIRVRSEYGKWCEFTFTLAPYKEEKQQSRKDT